MAKSRGDIILDNYNYLRDHRWERVSDGWVHPDDPKVTYTFENAVSKQREREHGTYLLPIGYRRDE